MLEDFEDLFLTLWSRAQKDGRWWVMSRGGWFSSEISFRSQHIRVLTRNPNPFIGDIFVSLWILPHSAGCVLWHMCEEQIIFHYLFQKNICYPFSSSLPPPLPFILFPSTLFDSLQQMKHLARLQDVVTIKTRRKHSWQHLLILTTRITQEKLTIKNILDFFIVVYTVYPLCKTTFVLFFVPVHSCSQFLFILIVSSSFRTGV